MKIETMDKALSVSNKIDQLRDIKKRIIESPLASDALKGNFPNDPDVLPDDEVLVILSNATTEFNNKWIEHIDSQIGVLQAEFDSL